VQRNCPGSDRKRIASGRSEGFRRAQATHVLLHGNRREGQGNTQGTTTMPAPIKTARRRIRYAGLICLLAPASTIAHVSVNVQFTEEGPRLIPVCGTSGPWVAAGSPSGGSYAWSATLGQASPTTGNSSTFLAGCTGGYGELTVTYTCADGVASAVASITVLEVIAIDPDPLVFAVGELGTAKAVTVPENMHYSDLITMSAEGVTVWSTFAGNITVTSDTPATGTITARCGCSEATGEVKAVGVTGLGVSGARASLIEPDTYIDCWEDDANAFVEITAELNPPCTAEEMEELIHWRGGDPHPTDRRKRLVRKDVANKTSVTATVGTSSFTVDVVVAKINWIKVWDQNITWLARTNPPDANDLYIPEADPFGWGYVYLSYGCSLGSRDYLVGKVEGDVAFPSAGVVGDLPRPIPIMLVPTDGNRSYTIRVAIDRNSSRELDEGDCGELNITVCVVKVDLDIDSNNDGSITGSDDPFEDIKDDPNYPGKVIPVNLPEPNDPNNLVPVELSVQGGSGEGTWQLNHSWLPDRVAVYRDRQRNEPITFGESYPESELPLTLYVEGLSTSGSVADLALKLSYDPGVSPGGVFSDTVRLTVARPAITDVVLPNDFLGTLDDDPNGVDWERGIRQQALNTIKVSYALQPQMDFSCDTGRITLRYTGPRWGESMVTFDLADDSMIPGAPGNQPTTAYPILDFPEDPNDNNYAGIRPTQNGGQYALVLESWTSSTGLHFTSDPRSVTGKPLLYDWHPEPNWFCPYTHRHICPGDDAYWTRYEFYYGVKFIYWLNAHLEGYDASGTLDEVLLGDDTGLQVDLVGVKRLRAVRDQKKCRSVWNYVKWEGFDGTVDERGGEPVFWGPQDPNRTDPNNVADYPAEYWDLVPTHVVGGTLENEPYLVDVSATADTSADPNLGQKYKRWNDPVWVRLNLEDVEIPVYFLPE